MSRRPACFCLLTLLAGLASLAVPAAARAQTAPADKAEVTAGALTRATSAAAGSSAQTAPLVSFETTTKDKIVTAQIGFQLTNLTVTFGLSGSVGDADTPTRLADLNGLRNKSTASVGIVWTHWNIGDPANDLSAACTEFEQSTGQKVANGDCTLLTLGRRMRDPLSKVTASERKRILRRIRPGAIVYAGANGKLAPEKFDFINAQDFSAGSESHTSWAASGVAGTLLSSGLLIAGTVTREVSYTAGSASQVCSPFGPVGSLKCANKVIGGPGSPARANRASVEIRKFLNTGFAISPKLTYNWTARVSGIEVPLYFFKDADGGLTGGVNLGWRSDTKAFTATAFVGQVLGMITK